MLIYQQVPAPFGVTAIKPWLHYAVWATGALLLASCLRSGTQAARAFKHHATAKLKELWEGFDITFRPRDDRPRRTGRDDGDDV